MQTDQEYELVPDDVIAELTGYDAPKKQCDHLRKLGIWFSVNNKTGRPKLLYSHLIHPVRTNNQDNEPNFSAI